jgi:hypothetical protein
MPWGLPCYGAIYGSTEIINTGKCVLDGKDTNGKDRYTWVPEDYKCVPDGKNADGGDHYTWVPEYYVWREPEPQYKIPKHDKSLIFSDSFEKRLEAVQFESNDCSKLNEPNKNYKTESRTTSKAYDSQSDVIDFKEFDSRFKTDNKPKQHERPSFLSLRDNEQGSEEAPELHSRQIIEHLKPVEEPKNNPNSHLYKTKYRNDVQQEEQTEKPSFKMVIPSEEITISSLEYKLLTKDRRFIQGVELIKEGFTYVTINYYKHKTNELKKELVKIRAQNKQAKRIRLDDVMNLLFGKLELRTAKEDTHGIKLPANLIELSECLNSSECMSQREVYAQYFRSNFEKRCTQLGLYFGFELDDILDYTTHEMIYHGRKPDFTIREIGEQLKEKRSLRKKEEFLIASKKSLDNIKSGKITEDEGAKCLSSMSETKPKEKPNLALTKELNEKRKTQSLRMIAFGDVCDHADKFNKTVGDSLESCESLGVYVYLEA